MDQGKLFDRYFPATTTPWTVAPSPPPAQYPPVACAPRSTTTQLTEVSLDEVYECLLARRGKIPITSGAPDKSKTPHLSSLKFA